MNVLAFSLGRLAPVAVLRLQSPSFGVGKHRLFMRLPPIMDTVFRDSGAAPSPLDDALQKGV